MLLSSLTFTHECRRVLPLRAIPLSTHIFQSVSLILFFPIVCKQNSKTRTMDKKLKSWFPSLFIIDTTTTLLKTLLITWLNAYKLQIPYVFYLVLYKSFISKVSINWCHLSNVILSNVILSNIILSNATHFRYYKFCHYE